MTTISMQRENGTMSDIPTHDLAIFSFDNLDQTNQHRLNVKGINKHGLQVIAIQAVLCNVGSPIPHSVKNTSFPPHAHKSLTESERFVESFMPAADDADINAYAAMFIIAVYRHQDRIATDD